MLSVERVDLVLLDIGLPGEDGLTLTRYLREHWKGAVIIVSGRGDPIERIVGLEVGADDFVSKPFELRELLARARSVLRRTAPAAAPDSAQAQRGHEFAGFRLECARGAWSMRRPRHRLTTASSTCCWRCRKSEPRAVARQLMERIHGRAAGTYDRGIDVQIGGCVRRSSRILSDPADQVGARCRLLFTAAVVRR